MSFGGIMGGVKGVVVGQSGENLAENITTMPLSG